MPLRAKCPAPIDVRLEQLTLIAIPMTRSQRNSSGIWLLLTRSSATRTGERHTIAAPDPYTSS